MKKLRLLTLLPLTTLSVLPMVSCGNVKTISVKLQLDKKIDKDSLTLTKDSFDILNKEQISISINNKEVIGHIAFRGVSIGNHIFSHADYDNNIVNNIIYVFFTDEALKVIEKNSNETLNISIEWLLYYTNA